MNPSEDEDLDPQSNVEVAAHDSRFSKSLKEYFIVLEAFKQRCIEKYGARAEEWFGV